MIHIGRAGTKLGAFSVEEVRQGLATGRFSLTDLGWKEGMANWAPLSQFPELTAPPEAPPLPVDAALAEAAAEPAEPAGLPWDERGERGLLSGFAETARLVLMQPAAAFARMRTSGGLSSPLLYNMIGGWIGAIASGVIAVMIARTQTLPANPTDLQKMFELTPEMAMMELKFFALMGWLIVTVCTLILSGITHLFLMLAGGANKPFHVTLRVFCFSYGSAQLLQLLPFCGSIAAPVWLIVCCVVGLATAHGTSTGRALAAMGFFLAAMLLCCVGICLVVFGAGVAAMQPVLNH